MRSGENATDRDTMSVLLGVDKRYRLLRLISEEELGTLWDAEDTSLKCPVTVRILADTLTATPELLEEFNARMGAVYGLDHPRVAYVYYYSNQEDGADQFVVMEPLPGEILAHRLERAGALDPEVAFRIAAEIAEALQAAHDNGGSHGGLTAGSVMLSAEGSVKVLDFGAAGSEGPHGDVYQLGMILRQMLAGRRPSAGTLAGSKGVKKTRRSKQGGGAAKGRAWEAALDPNPEARPSAALMASMLQQEAAEEHGRRGAGVSTETRTAEEPTEEEAATFRKRARLETEAGTESDGTEEVNVPTAEPEAERAGAKLKDADRRDAAGVSTVEESPSGGAPGSEAAARTVGRALRQEEARLKGEARRALAEARKAEAARTKAADRREKRFIRLEEEEIGLRNRAREAAEESQKADERARRARRALPRQKARLRDAARTRSGQTATAARELEERQEALRAEIARLTADEARRREEARAAMERARAAIEQAEQADDRLGASEEARKRAEAQLEADIPRAAEESRKLEEARVRSVEADRSKAAELEAETARLADEATRAASEAREAEEARARAERAREEEVARFRAEEAELQARAEAAAQRARNAQEEAQRAETARRDAVAASRGKGRHRRNWSLRNPSTADPPSAPGDAPAER